MGTTMEAAVASNRRQFILGAGAVVIAAAAGVGYYLWNRQVLSIDAGAEGSAPTGDLMAAGPLPDMELGKPDAPVTMIEYASMTCPHCAHFNEATFPELKKRLIETGKVRFIFREFPLDPLAAAASALARCAPKENYFPMVETLFETQRDWIPVQNRVDKLREIAKQAGIKQDDFEACLKNDKITKGIEDTRERASSKFGVQSTPTFFINGKKFSGVMSIEDVEREVAPYLKS
jgi:protein-disulfide isomerase